MKASGTGFNLDGNREMADDHRRGRANGTADAATAASGSGGSGGNYDVFNDEIKVYKYEGEQEPPASETLSEDKRVLVTDVEENMKQSEEESPEDKTHLNGILENPFSRGLSSFSSFIPPYPYPGCSGPFGLGAVSVPHPGFPFYNDFFAQPPPAHMGFPSWSLATPPGFCSPTPMYGLPGQASPFYGLSATHQGPPIYPPSTFYPTGFSPVHTWPHGSGYPFSCFPQLSKFQPSSMLGSHLGFSYPGISHPALVSSLSQSNGSESPLGFRSSAGNSTSKKLDPSKSNANSTSSNNNSNLNSNNNKINNIHSGLHHPFAFNPQLRHHHHHPDHVLHLQSHPQVSLPQRSEFVTSPRGSSRSPLLTSSSSSSSSTNKVPHIKKPLNAFMLFMKEMRQKVIDECTLKESSAINQILGRKWHSLDRNEQTKYYDMARREKELHSAALDRQLYPSWTARDNYAIHARKKRRKEMMRDDDKAGDAEDRNAIDCMNAKKCRARYGVEQQYKWCKPCRRKKRCIRFMHDTNSDPFEENEDENSSTSTRLNVPRGNNSNPSAADSTTEIFSPTPSTNADDSRNRCKVAQPMEDGVRQGQPVDRPQHSKQSYASVANHVQLNLNVPQSDFSTSSTTAAAAAVVVSQTSATSQTGPTISSHEYLQRTTSSRIPCREMAPFFASTTTTSNQSAGRCSHYCQQSSTRHDGQSQMSASVSFPDVPSPDVASFSADDGIGKVKIQEGRLQQAATIF